MMDTEWEAIAWRRGEYTIRVDDEEQYRLYKFGISVKAYSTLEDAKAACNRLMVDANHNHTDSGVHLSCPKCRMDLSDFVAKQEAAANAKNQ